MKKSILVLAFMVAIIAANAQYTRSDSLRGSITPEREWWDLKYYHLDIKVEPERKYISGSVRVVYDVKEPYDVMQIDLQKPLEITEVEDQDGNKLTVRSEGNAHFIQLKDALAEGEMGEIIVRYEGNPKVAIRPPWDGGITWTMDGNGNHFIASSCQGLGASAWWPCKDHPADEVDSMLISVEVPEELTNVSNGRLTDVQRDRKSGTRTFNWFVNNPINAYGVNINIGDYVSWKEKYEGENGMLDITYWALKEDEKRAREQWKQVPGMLDAFEHWFGPYPFYEDGYQLVQAPYLGMEHQSSITYGNEFENGYLGYDLSQTGWGLKFDYIIIHESGHEWFANNITYNDAAHMWIHESFTTYSEALYVEYHFGKEAGQEYVRGLRNSIGNRGVILGDPGVNKEGVDIYSKGANILNTIRQVVNDDDTWRSVLRGLGEEFYHKTVSTDQIVDYISFKTNMDLGPVFDFYLMNPSIPVFEYFFREGAIYYRWNGTDPGFNMPIDVIMKGEPIRLYPASDWNRTETKGEELEVDPDYYISVLKMM